MTSKKARRNVKLNQDAQRDNLINVNRSIFAKLARKKAITNKRRLFSTSIVISRTQITTTLTVKKL
jgi:hypothetical protein